MGPFIRWSTIVLFILQRWAFDFRKDFGIPEITLHVFFGFPKLCLLMQKESNSDKSESTLLERRLILELLVKLIFDLPNKTHIVRALPPVLEADDCEVEWLNDQIRTTVIPTNSSHSLEITQTDETQLRTPLLHSKCSKKQQKWQTRAWHPCSRREWSSPRWGEADLTKLQGSKMIGSPDRGINQRWRNISDRRMDTNVRNNVALLVPLSRARAASRPRRRAGDHWKHPFSD